MTIEVSIADWVCQPSHLIDLRKRVAPCAIGGSSEYSDCHSLTPAPGLLRRAACADTVRGIDAMSAINKRPHRYAGLSIEDRADARRRDFVTAGIELMGTVGLRQTRIKDLCETAGLTTRYFYESFGDLEELAVAVVQKTAVDTALRVFAAMLTATEAKLRFRRGAQEFTRILEEAPGVARILLVETAAAGGKLAEWRSRVLTGGANLALDLISATRDDAQIAVLVEQWTREFMAGAEVARDLSTARDPRAVLFTGALSEFAVAWIEHRIDMTAGEAADYLAEFAESLLAPSLPAR